MALKACFLSLLSDTRHRRVRRGLLSVPASNLFPHHVVGKFENTRVHEAPFFPCVVQSWHTPPPTPRAHTSVYALGAHSTQALTPAPHAHTRTPHPTTQALGSAYEKFGFVILQNHGVPDDLIARATACSKQFFSMSAEDKMKYHVKGAGGARGYTAFGVETAKGSTHHDLKEFWHLGRDLEPGHRFESLMPPNVPVAEGEFTAATAAIFSALDALGGKVLEALAVHLGQKRAYFEDKVDEGNSILRVIHYPPVVREGEDGETALARVGHVRRGRCQPEQKKQTTDPPFQSEVS